MVIYSRGEGIISNNIFKINQRLLIALSNKPDSIQYHSRIEDITDTHMIIAMPMSKGYPVLLWTDSCFYGRALADDAVYAFTSTFINKSITPFPIWVVSLPRDVRRIQQRDFVRFNVVLPVEMTILPDEGSSEETEPMTELVSTKDISGGGIQLIVKEPLPHGTRLQLSFELPEFGSIQVAGKVVRVDQSPADRQVYWLGVRFVDVHDSVSNKIIKFIFKKQLEQRQKGF